MEFELVGYEYLDKSYITSYTVLEKLGVIVFTFEKYKIIPIKSDQLQILINRAYLGKNLKRNRNTLAIIQTFQKERSEEFKNGLVGV